MLMALLFFWSLVLPLFIYCFCFVFWDDGAWWMRFSLEEPRIKRKAVNNMWTRELIGHTSVCFGLQALGSAWAIVWAVESLGPLRTRALAHTHTLHKAKLVDIYISLVAPKLSTSNMAFWAWYVHIRGKRKFMKMLFWSKPFLELNRLVLFTFWP